MLELIAVLSVVLDKRADFAVALALFVVNAVLSFIQEQRALAAVATLRHQMQVAARVLHDGLWQSMPARQLVSGDVTRVRTGDFLPAGCTDHRRPTPDRPIRADRRTLDEAAITAPV